MDLCRLTETTGDVLFVDAERFVAAHGVILDGDGTKIYLDNGSFFFVRESPDLVARIIGRNEVPPSILNEVPPSILEEPPA